MSLSDMAEPIPYVRDFDFSYGSAEEVSPLIRRVVARNPSPFTYTGTGTYIVGRGEVAVIDPGPDIDEHIAALEVALKGERVSHILVTHSHSDHCEAVPRFKEICGARVFAYPPPRGDDESPAAADVKIEEGVDNRFKPDVLLKDGDVIEGKGWTIECLHTPGHMSNHLCFALYQENALFTGDHVMGCSTTVINPPDGNMRAYMASLRRLKTRTDDIYWPTHGAPVRQPEKLVNAYIAHRQEREAQILACLNQETVTIPAMVARLYAEVDPRLHPAAARSVLAHLIKLMEDGRVVRVPESVRGDDVIAQYQIVRHDPDHT
jgi:glyoxylase-like metal-dependent hydrolase (beta-lactamase superfamily II)